MAVVKFRVIKTYVVEYIPNANDYEGISTPEEMLKVDLESGFIDDVVADFDTGSGITRIEEYIEAEAVDADSIYNHRFSETALVVQHNSDSDKN